MIPFPLLLALVLAFGIDLPTIARPLPRLELANRLLDAGFGLALVALVAGASGLIIRLGRRRLDRFGLPAEWLLGWASKGVAVLGLAVFAWTMVWLDWPRVVAWGLNLRKVAFAEQAALLAPFLVGQVVAWSGLYPAEAALRPSIAAKGLPAHLGRRVRQSLGMVLPILAFYAVGRDLIRPGTTGGPDSAAWQLLGASGIAAGVFALSPAFVRLAWPTRRLPDGPLRDRLERLARRLRFRCTDILVWDTQGQAVNACVTGAVPWFRYVLITDEMIALMEPEKIEAIFGHEIGHATHRHLPFFALFCLGSMGLGVLVGEGLARAWNYEAAFARWVSGDVAEVLEGVAALAALGGYFFFAFGPLSRRFERQADLAGCLAVSCGRAECPPHHDPNAPDAAPGPIRDLCPTSLALFADALAEVALFNGLSLTRREWRHGSIAGRIAFVRSLEGRPDLVRRFQAGTTRVRWVVSLLLGAATLAAVLVARPG